MSSSYSGVTRMLCRCKKVPIGQYRPLPMPHADLVIAALKSLALMLSAN